MKLFATEKASDMEIWHGSDFDYSRARDSIAPSIVEIHPDYMQLGNNFSRTLVITSYPSVVHGNWLSQLYRFKGNLSISTHSSPTSADKMINEYSKSIEELEVRLEAPLSARRKQDTQNRLDSADKILKKLMSGNNNQIFHVHMYLHLQAESLEMLNRLTQDLQGTLWRTGLVSATPNDRMLEAFEAVLPINKNTLPEYTFQNMDAEAASSMFPYDESEIFHVSENAIVKGRNKTTNSLILVDQYLLKNYNEFILGMSGAGKSAYMKKDMLRHFMKGIKVFIIDPEREYLDIVKKRGGQHVVISSMSGTIINPLEIMHNSIDMVEDYKEDGKNQYEVVLSKSLLHQKISRLKVFFKLIKKDLTPLEAALIEDVLVSTYQEKGITWDTDFSEKTSKDFPILTNFYEAIQKSKDPRLADFSAILKTYVSGSNSLMFNGHTNVNLKGDLICFDLKDLEDDSDVQPAAMYNVLSYLWDEITKDNTVLKRLYVDEAHIMADPDNPRAMKFLFNIYKRIRKYKGGATAATQQIADYLSAIENKRNYGKAVIGNSQSKVILSLEESDIEDLTEYKVMKLSEEEKRILTTDKKGEGIIIIGKHRAHMEVDFTPKEAELIDPEMHEKMFGNGVVAS